MSETRPNEEKDSQTWTTNTGQPVADNINSKTVGTRGPVLLEDFHLLEKLANFDRERIPERVVHARGATAKGVFTVTQDITDLTCADMFKNVGMETPLIARFSTVIHERGSPEHLRDVRGFSVKFYTQEGNWDFVGNNMPVFFVRDGISFPDMVHALKPNPKNHIQEWWRIWDFFASHPESTHVFSWLLDDVGIPKDYRHMPGFGVHTYKLVNQEGKETYVKWHWDSEQGEENITSDDQAVSVGGTNQQHATQALYDSIEAGDFPAWTLKIQTMDPATENDYDFDPLDATKIWPEDQFPLREVGRMVLNENPENFFNENEQLAFSPSVIVPGMDFSNDKLLQSRLFSYQDAQRYRLGTNYLQLPVNAPKCPFHNNNFDGTMNPVKRTGEVNYYPSIVNKDLHEAKPTNGNTPSKQHVEGERTKEMIGKQNDFQQAGHRFRNFDPERQERFVMRVVGKLSLPKVTDEMREIWVKYWTQCDETLGQRISTGLKQAQPGPPVVPISQKEIPGSQGFGLPKMAAVH